MNSVVRYNIINNEPKSDKIVTHRDVNFEKLLNKRVEILLKKDLKRTELNTDTNSNTNTNTNTSRSMNSCNKDNSNNSNNTKTKWERKLLDSQMKVFNNN